MLNQQTVKDECDDFIQNDYIQNELAITPGSSWRSHSVRLHEILQPGVVSEEASRQEDENVTRKEMDKAGFGCTKVFDRDQDDKFVCSKWNVSEMQPIVLVQRISW
ncbi:unnamed protein product, partial [Ceratitis capitata]